MSSSPVAVAASDPGGNGEPTQELQPKVLDAPWATAGDGERSSAGISGPARDADVTMMEAVEEAPVVADVKVEGKAVVAGDAAVTADVVRDGGGAASDPLYATESAGMVSEEGCGYKSVDGTRGLDGGDGGEEKLEVEARVLQSDAERKPVLARDGAVAGDAVEAPGSATTEHAEAESNKLEVNYVNATPVIGNKGKDNGVAHCDKEIQNDVLSDIEGSSKIREDDKTPTPEQQDDRSEMLPPTWKQVPDGGNNQSSNDSASPTIFDQCARYCLPPLEKGDFRVSDLVWGKVKSHPWWPGEIFYPSDASELALKHQKKGNHLVAYFGDKTFAWCNESQLKPFVTNYLQMEKQSSSDAFVSSVNYALEELSRRILSGMSCSCLPEELSDNGMSYMVENAGLKDGVTCSTVKQAEILEYFSPENLLRYVKSLALSPGQGGDLLDLVVACSQLTSFYRSKGCPELASFQTGSAWVDNGMDTSPTKNVMLGESVTVEVQPSNDKPKRGRGRPRKRKPEDNLELTDKKATSNLNNTGTSNDPGERQDEFDDLQNRKKRSLESFEDSETNTSTPTFGSSFKIGDCIRRAANQLIGPSSTVMPQNEPTVHNKIAEAENGEFDISSDDAVNELPVKKRAKRKRMHMHHLADPKDLLSKLCSVAMVPMTECSFSAMIISYFSDYRNYVASASTEVNIIGKVKEERGGKRTNLASPEVETTDHMQDTYWSGVSLHNDPIHSLRGASANMRPRRRRRSSRQTYVPSSDLSSPVQYLQLGMLGPKKQIQVTERPIIHVNEKMVDEVKPTALVLSFGRSTALPSKTDLIRMFSRYGPLKETETEVHKNSNTVKVVFKKRVDAERAFNVAGKYGSFGRSLSSFRLVNLPFSLGTTELSYPALCPEDSGPKVPAPRESGVPQGSVQVDIVNKADKAEAVKKTSVEQVKMVKQAGQAEDTIKRALHAEGKNEESSEVLLDNMQIEVVSEAPKDGLVCGDSVVEASKDTMEVDNVDEARDEARVPQEFQAQALTEELRQQAVGDENEKTDNKSTAEALAGETAEGETTAEARDEEAIMADKTVDNATVEAPDENTTTAEKVVEARVPQDFQAQALTEELRQQAVGDENEKTDNKSTAEALAGEIAEGETTAEARDEEAITADKTVDNATVEAPDENTTTAEKVVEARVPQEFQAQALTEELRQQAVGDENEKTDNKSTAEALAGETAKGETTAEARDEEAITADKTVDNATIEAPDENTTTAEKVVEARVPQEFQAQALTEELRQQAVGDENEKTDNKSTAEALAGETAKGETTAEALDEEAITADKSVDNATVEAPDENTTTAEKVVEDATVEASVVKITTAEKTVEDATIEATIAEKAVEDATVEAPDEKTAATVEARDGQTGVAEQTG